MVIFLKSKNTAPFRVLSWPSSLKHPIYVPRGREYSRDSEVPERGTRPNQGAQPSATPRQSPALPGQGYLSEKLRGRGCRPTFPVPSQTLAYWSLPVPFLSKGPLYPQTSCQASGISLDTTFFHRPQLSKSGWFNYLPWTLFLSSERQVLSSPCDPEGRN